MRQQDYSVMGVRRSALRRKFTTDIHNREMGKLRQSTEKIQELLDIVEQGGGTGGGGSVDPELLEGFIPLQRQFSDDYNNDFAR